MGKYIIGVIAFILVVAGGYYLYEHHNFSMSGTPSAVSTTAPVQVATSTYATSTFSVVYPSDFSVNANFSNTEVNPAKPIAGVQFTIPGDMATGTNLSADSYVSVEQLPHAKNCTGDIYLAADVTPTTETIDGVTYSVASSSEGAAGNFYDESVFALPGSNPCTAVRYSIHSTDINNYPAGTVTQFDPSVITAAFDKIRDSLQLQ